MAEEEEGRSLPEHLVEKIIAMLPFPSIFKARCLSRSWLARLSAISSEQDDSMKCLAASFQKQVSQRSGNWRTFCPVYIDADVFTAYDGVFGKWLNLPSLSHLPKELFKVSTLQMEGPLLYGFVPEWRGFAVGVCVANVLTGRWRQLPRRPKEGENVVFKVKLVIGSDVETYKVILVCREKLPYERWPDEHLVWLQIYDSASDAWTNKTFSVTVDISEYVFDAYLDGVLYIAKLHNSVEFVLVDIKEGVMEEIKLPDVDARKFVSANLLVHKSSLFMVLHSDSFHKYRLNLRKIDLSSLCLSEVAEFVDKGKMYFHAVSDGDRLFFLGYNRDGPAQSSVWNQLNMVPKEVFFCSHVTEYNFHEHKFDFVSNVPPSADHELRGHYGSSFMDRFRHRWMRSSFQPGLCPFLAV